MSKNWQVFDRFAIEGKALRREYDAVFRDPKNAMVKRFTWDYWHVPGQYTHLRTPAYHFFSPGLYRRFHERLVRWGRETLGCHDVSPTWLSCYVEGCRQDFHVDLPHGPWAFVYSLTPWQERSFSGGETFLLRENVLEHWRQPLGQSRRGREQNAVLDLIEPKFNRLTVFDPRVPHGVREVRGVQDPCAGRLVIHGWFVNPRPFIEGPLPRARLAKLIQDCLENLDEKYLRRGASVQGLLSVRFQVTREGRIRELRVLSDLLRDRAAMAGGARAIRREILAWIPRQKFTTLARPARVTLPFQFE